MTQITPLNVKKYLIIIALCALIVRLIFVIVNDPIPPPELINLDDVDFNYLGWKFSTGQGLTDKYGDPTTTRFPLYPVFLGIIYFIFGWHVKVVFIIQAIIGIVTPLLVYLIAREFFETKISLLAAAITAFYPSFIAYSGRLMTENLFLPLLALVIYFVIRLRRDASVKTGILTGVSLGLALLTRGVVMPMLILVPVYAVFIGGRKQIISRIPGALLIVCSTLIVLSPLVIRNYIHFGKFFFVSSKSGPILRMSFGYWPAGHFFELDRAYAYVDSVGRDNAEIEVFHSILVEDNLFGYKGMQQALPYIYPNIDMPEDEDEFSDFMLNDVKQMITANPMILVVKTVREFLRFWHFLNDRGGYVIGYGLMLPFFLVGLWLLRKRWWELAPLLAFFIYTWGIETLFMSAARFRMPFETVMIVIGAYCIYEMFTKLKPLFKPILITVLVLGVNLFFSFNENILRNVIRGAVTSIGLPVSSTGEEFVPHLKNGVKDPLKLNEDNSE